VLSQAHSPEDPDWRILSAQGAVLDQMGRFEEARPYYISALKIAPDEPSVLSNLGLSYLLSKDLAKAEETLRRAHGRDDKNQRVRMNLAVVLSLEGRQSDAEGILKADLPPDEATAKVAELKRLHGEEGSVIRTERGSWLREGSSQLGCAGGGARRRPPFCQALLALGRRLNLLAISRIGASRELLLLTSP